MLHRATLIALLAGLGLAATGCGQDAIQADPTDVTAADTADTPPDDAADDTPDDVTEVRVDDALTEVPDTEASNEPPLELTTDLCDDPSNIMALAETYVQIWARRETDVVPRRAEEEDAFGLGDLGDLGGDAMET